MKNTKCLSMTPTKNPISARMPDGDSIISSHDAVLDMTRKLSERARTGHVFPDLQSGPLLSLGVMCDDGCTVILHADILYITKDGETLLTGLKNRSNGMWEIDLADQAPPAPAPPLTPVTNSLSVNNAIANNVLAEATKPDLCRYYHAACFSPVKSTWLAAIKNGHFASWPGLTEDFVKKYYEKSINTSLGHMHQT